MNKERQPVPNIPTGKEWELVPECVLKAVGLLSYLQLETDYLPDSVYEWINKVIHAIECEDRWDSQQPVRKTLDECKDELARNYNHDNWDAMMKHIEHYPCSLNKACDEVAELYASQTKAVEPARKTLDDLIKTIQIDWSNMDHIRKFGVINGTLKSEIIRIAETHAKSKVAELQHPHIEVTSENLIGRVKDRFKELKAKEFDWRSFYHGWIEGRADWNFKKPTTNN